jgi:hypothetical protein
MEGEKSFGRMPNPLEEIAWVKLSAKKMTVYEGQIEPT